MATAPVLPEASATATPALADLSQPPAVTRRASLPVDATTKPVKDAVPKSPANGHASGHAKKPHSKPTTQGSGDHHMTPHPHGCSCHRCVRGYNEVTHMSEPYCPNPSLPNICKDYETKVRIIQRIPEMRKVEKTFFVKQLVHEDRITKVRKSRVVMEDVEDWVKVPVIKEVSRLKKIKVYKIREEIRTCEYEVPVIEYERRCTTKKLPRVCMEDCEEEIQVPVIKEVPEVVTVQIPTGEFCENSIEEYCTPGDFNLLCKDGRHHGDHHKHRSECSSSESESSDSESDDDDESKQDDVRPKKPLSPIKTKPNVPAETDPKPKPKLPHHEPHPDPKAYDKPHEDHLKPKPHEDPLKPKPHEDPLKPKPQAKPIDQEPKPKPQDKPQAKPIDQEPKPKPHDGAAHPHPETKPKAPATEGKPKVLVPKVP